jgi:hypothetical protein
MVSPFAGMTEAAVPIHCLNNNRKNQSLIFPPVQAKCDSETLLIQSHNFVEFNGIPKESFNPHCFPLNNATCIACPGHPLPFANWNFWEHCSHIPHTQNCPECLLGTIPDAKVLSQMFGNPKSALVK